VKKKRSPQSLLRARNKELREAKALIEKLSATPSYTLSFLRRAVKEAESARGRNGATVRVCMPPRLTWGPVISFPEMDTFIHVLKDEE
jgi:hypothetical protein